MARLVSCGVSPTKSPRLRPRPLPSSHTPEVCVWRGGALPRRCPAAGTPCSKDCASQKEGTPKGRGPGARGFGEQGGPWAVASRSVFVHTAYKPSASLERTHSGSQEGTRVDGPRPSPSLIPKYFPPSRSSEERKIPSAAGPAPPPPQSPPLANGPDSSQELGGWAAANPTCGADAGPPRPSPRRDQTACPGWGAGHRQVGGPGAYPRVEGGAGRGEGGLNHLV